MASSLVALALAVSRGPRRAARQLLEEVVAEQGVERVAEWVLANDIAYRVYLLASEAGLDSLASRLERRARDVVEAARHTAELMKLVDKVFARAGIGYTVFKTFNTIGRVDVDIDLIVSPRDYWRAVKLLYHEAGLKPIDSIEKTYATGFMAPGNPIVLDLHTELTVLGIPYIDNTILLRNSRRESHELPGGYMVEACTATPIADTVARIGHALIKEAEIKIDDVTETLPVLTRHPGEVRRILRDQAIPEAYHEYLAAVTKILRGHPTPMKLSRATSIELITKRITRRRQPHLILKAAYNLRYPRNTAHIAHIVLAAIR